MMPSIFQLNLGRCYLDGKPHTLFPTHTWLIIVAKRFNWCLISSPKNCPPKGYDFVLVIICKTFLLFFVYACRSWGFFHAIQPFRPWRRKALPVVDLHTLLLCASDSFTSFFVVVLGFSLTVGAKVCSALGEDVRLLPERFSVCVAPSFLYLGTIYFTDTCGTFSCLEIAPKKKPDL